MQGRGEGEELSATASNKGGGTERKKKILGKTTLKGDTLMICKAHKMLGHLQIIRTSFPQQLQCFRNSTRLVGTSEHTS